MGMGGTGLWPVKFGVWRSWRNVGCPYSSWPHMTVPGGTPTILVSRRLDPIGHFVADATIPTGATRYDIFATTQSGQAIATYIVITPGS